jgi:hypothetical protein
MIRHHDGALGKAKIRREQRSLHDHSFLDAHTDATPVGEHPRYG